MREIKSVIRHSNGNLTVNGVYGVIVDDEACAYPYSEVVAFVAEHPEALIPEPTPPAPTAEELARLARESRNAALAEHDTLVRIALRDQRSGDLTAEARLAQLDAYAKALCDWPSSAGFPDIATMPKLADFIKA